MRVTCDIDKGGVLKSLILGLILFNKRPEVRKTRRGYHLIWKGLNLSRDEVLRFRMILRDDPKRVIMDGNPKKVFQVLFKEKEIYKREGSVIRNGKVIGNFLMKVNYCDVCGMALITCGKFKDGKFYCLNCLDKGIVKEKVKRIIKEKVTDFILMILGKFSKLPQVSS